MQNISEIDELIKLISKLPGLGPKSAKRIVLQLINNREELIKPLAKNIADQWSIEASSVYQGYFHILGGTISSSNNQKKEDLLINSLVERVNKDNIEEIILATSATVEGQTTAFYIQDSLKNTNVKISKLAQGLPVGGEIENLDDGTLISAFKNRQNFL